MNSPAAGAVYHTSEDSTYMPKPNTSGLQPAPPKKEKVLISPANARAIAASERRIARRLLRSTKEGREKDDKRRFDRILSPHPAVDIRDGGASLGSYFRSLSRPWSNIAKIPYGTNNVQSTRTSTYRATATTSISVAANTTVQIYLPPGHAAFSEMDDFAFHCQLQKIGAGASTPANTRVFGPVEYYDGSNTHAPLAAVITDSLAVNAAEMDSSVASAFSLDYDVLPPYSAKNEYGHLRWVQVSSAIRVLNTSQKLYVGGDIVTFTPSMKLTENGSGSMSTQANFKPYGIWHKWTPTHALQHFKPLPDDVAFWHPIGGTGQAVTALAPLGGTYVWLNNPTGVAQSYDVDIVCNYELAGVGIATLATEKVVTPASSSVMEPVNTLMLNHPEFNAMHSAVADKIAAGISPIGKVVSDEASALGSKLYSRLPRGFASLVSMAGSVV